MIPGELRCGKGKLELNSGRKKKELEVVNKGDRPIQVGSHYHFADVNDSLHFKRAEAKGFRLDIPAGKSLRFEPQASATVTLVALAGKRRVPGLRLEQKKKKGS
jgi:urease subunit beta